MKNESAQAGFTLIEVLVVAVLLGVFGALSADVLTNIMKAQNKAKIIGALEQSGSYALSRMEQEIRKAEKITCCESYSNENNYCDLYPVASTGLGLLVEGQEIMYSLSSSGGTNALARTENPGPDSDPVFLTNTDVVNVRTRNEFKESSNYVFNCDSSGKRVDIHLELEPAQTPQRQDFEGEVILETTVLLRGRAY